MENEKYDNTSYQSAIGIAIVSAVFSVFIAVLLSVSVYHIKKTDPGRAAELEMMKEQAKAYPADETLAQAILAFDTQLRRDQFGRLYFVKRGTMLLVVTLVLLCGSLIWAKSHHDVIPQVQKQGDLKTMQIQQAGRTRMAFSIALVLIGGGALFWVLQVPEMDADIPAAAPQASAEPAVDYATMEEMENQWYVFRGPGGLGICDFDNIPDTWDGASGQNILWKSPVPLAGHNSPVVWEDRVFLAGATDEKQQIYCYEADSGKLLWQKDVTIPAGPDRAVMDVMEDTGYAACTAVTDGRRVCGMFAGGDIGCFTVDGEPLWEKHLGVPESMYGFAASLTAYENLVIVQWDVGYEDDQSKLIALDFQTGNVAWQTPRPVPNSWSSPTVVKVEDAYQVLTCGQPFVMGYNPKTGVELYRAECVDGDIASTPIIADNKVFAIEPYNLLVAVNIVDASGDISETHIAWENDSQMPDICSPVSNGTFIWTLTTPGQLGCFKVADGTEVYTESLNMNFMASPTLVKNQMYLLSEKGVMLIVETGDRYKEIKQNKLGEKCYASPAFAPGRIYIRAKENLYAIGSVQ